MRCVRRFPHDCGARVTAHNLLVVLTYSLMYLHDHRGLGFDGSIGDLTALIDVGVTVDIRWR